MELDIYQVDAFTSAIFGGNPAAVVPLESWLADDVMQKIAMENNLSETAFYVPEGDGYHLRWFTPHAEVDLCGHATLATAFTIFERGHKSKRITFTGRSGTLYVDKNEHGFTLDFPVWTYEARAAHDAISEALGKAPVALYTGYDWVALYDDEATVRALTPNMEKLAQIDEMRGILATATASTDGLDFVSRAFFPRIGVPEDPVTGSAHCILTPFWAERLGKTKLNAYQASARGGALLCEIKDDRIYISGDAALYLKGTIFI